MSPDADSASKKVSHLDDLSTPRPLYTFARLLPSDRLNKRGNFADEEATAHSHIIC